MTVKLSAANLDKLPAKVERPNYRPSDLTGGIVHFGVGNFHRSHQAIYLDALFNAGRDRDWALVGAGVFDFEKPGRAEAEGAGLVDHRGRTGRRSHGGARHRRDDRLHRAGRECGSHRHAGRPCNAHRLHDDHRGRLLHRSGLAAVQPEASRHRRRRGQSRPAEDGVRPGPRRTEEAPRRRRAAIHRHVVRQHPP